MAKDELIDMLTGEPLAVLSAEERAFDRLCEWLDRPAWSGSPNSFGSLPWAESVCVLAGVDPELSMFVSPDYSLAVGGKHERPAAGLKFLPSGLTFYGFEKFPRDPYELDNLWEGVSQAVGILLGLRLKTMPPAKAIKLAFDSGIPIPWLRLAQAHPVARQKLPRGLKTANPDLTNNRRANASYGARPKDWDKQIYEIEALWRAGRSNKQIANALSEKGYTNKRGEPPSESSVAGWVRSLKSGLTAEKATRGFREWKTANR